MFTGIIIELGEVVSLDKRTDNARLAVMGNAVMKDAAVGDSICVNGVCLTAVSIEGGAAAFDVSYETLRSTNLGALKTRDRVNLEPSLKPDSKLGGHFVTGHVEGVGRISKRTPAGNAVKIEIESPRDVLKYLVEKGSVAVDGISLTVVDVLKDGFSVVIIPHTARMTTVGFKNQGDTVNLEPDILAKYVAKFLSGAAQDRDSSLMSALKKSGFIAG